jgi:hypothetical protein
VYNIKSNRQVHYSPLSQSSFRTPHKKENSGVIGTALTIHHDTRNKDLVSFLASQGYCISYNRTLMIETSIANAVIENMMHHNDIYIPSFIKRDKFLFFAMDNIDFCEDTPHGKDTLHATVTVVFQQQQHDDGNCVTVPLQIHEAKSMTLLPYDVDMENCNKPAVDTSKTAQTAPLIYKLDPQKHATTLGQLEWCIMRATDHGEDGDTRIPGWGGYNSLISTSTTTKLTNVGTLPLIPAPAHEWSTLLTVLKQAQNITTMVVADSQKTVITLDMALYEKALQLTEYRPDMKGQYVLRLGELHVSMAGLWYWKVNRKFRFG